MRGRYPHREHCAQLVESPCFFVFLGMAYDIKLVAFVGLVVIQTGIGSINKIALIHGGGKV
jgi:hypothetical protein